MQILFLRKKWSTVFGLFPWHGRPLFQPPKNGTPLVSTLVSSVHVPPADHVAATNALTSTALPSSGPLWARNPQQLLHQPPPPAAMRFTVLACDKSTPIFGPTLSKILKRIPRGSRDLAAHKLSSVIDKVVRINDEGTWNDLFQFNSKYLFAPIRGGRCRNLTSTYNSRLNCETLSPPPPQVSIRRRQKKEKPCSADPLMSLASHISAKLEEGDFKGAVRIACSDDSIADMDQATLTAFQQKHPTPPADSVIPDLPPTN